MNYYDYLCSMYPDKEELLWIYKFSLDHHMYSYGDHLSISWETEDKNRYKVLLLYLYNRFLKHSRIAKLHAIVSDAPRMVNKSLEDSGYHVSMLSSCLSAKSFHFIYNFRNFDFNIFLKEDFVKRVDAIKMEFKHYLTSNKVRFVLLSNDVLPINRLAIIASKEAGIPSGVFLHGLPAIYNLKDNFGADYTFVWGDALKENYVNLGCKRDIIVTGNPNYSNTERINGSHDKVLVVSFCAGDALDGESREIGDRGLCIQYAYMVETALKKIGVNGAILRVHPHENPEWYKKYVDNEFYQIDSNPLMTTLAETKYVVGPISSLIIDAISHRIPYYPFVISKAVNVHSYEIVPPFRPGDALPVAYSDVELADNLREKKYVTEESLSSYYDKEYDVSLIVNCFLPIS